MIQSFFECNSLICSAHGLFMALMSSDMYRPPPLLYAIVSQEFVGRLCVHVILTLRLLRELRSYNRRKYFDIIPVIYIYINSITT